MNATLTLLPIFIITLAISIVGLAGGFLLLWRERLMQRGARFLMSFAAGSILGAAFFDVLPEALNNGERSPATVSAVALGGVIVFFILEKLLILHHHTHDAAAEDAMHGADFHSLKSARPLVIFGDALHNFLDGAVIAIAFLTNISLGAITSLAVVAHEIPQEIGDFSILLHSGMSKKRVILWNFLGALVSPIGAVVGYFAFAAYHKIEALFLAFIVGNFIYLALADLVPTIKHERRTAQSLAQIATLLFGVAVVWQTSRWLHAG